MTNMFAVSASFTRPNDTTAYAANDLVANSTTAGSVVPMSFVIPKGNGNGIQIRAIKIHKTGATATNANFAVHLYASSPTVTNGDNGAWLSTHSGYLGKLEAAIMTAFSDDAAVVDSMSEAADLHFVLNSSSVVYGLMMADAAYTPEANEVFTVTIIGESQKA